MINSLRFIILLLISLNLNAQNKYKASNEILNIIEHTKLKLTPNFQKEEMEGEAWISAKPYFYTTNSITLNAKAMIIHQVKSNDGRMLKYEYKNDSLTIQLLNNYTKDQIFNIYIKYTSRPKEVKEKGGAAVTDAKGLYFIDSRDEDPEKPTQLWTQGEPTSNSVWFPTIDSPNQKSTQEIYLTVPKKMVTLSNGKLISQVQNANDTRTDYWKQTQKHAPYLFFIAAGEFALIKDSWKGKEVNYYVEKDYEPYAKEIFGLTPEMITFFSKKFGYDFPWDKYSQIICRDYVSGAMENTTAVIHAENANQKHGQLVDENIWEDVIAHELAHHWFGDLVTTESWANLTVNESFANYSEYLWREYKYGLDHADARREEEIKGYIAQKDNYSKNLVRFNHNKPLDVFDAVSYNKGGAILHMLRNYLEDDAFFKGLEKYLKDNQYGTGEVHQLRLALESVSGKDLNWFFNQWYYGNGHPKLEIKTEYGDKYVNLAVFQKQGTPLFEFPVKVEIFEGKTSKTHTIWVNKNELNTFKIETQKKANLVLFDADNYLLADVEENKTTEQYIFQYKNAKRYLARKFALIGIAEEQEKNAEVVKILQLALSDKYFGIRILALELLNFENKNILDQTILKIAELALKDEKTLVRSKALEILLKQENIEKFITVFESGLKSESFGVLGKSLEGLYKIDKEKANLAIKEINLKDIEGDLLNSISKIIIENKDESKISTVSKVAGDYLLNSFKNPETAKFQKIGFDWIMSGDYLQETKNVTTAVISFYKKYNKFSENVKKIANSAIDDAIKLKESAYSVKKTTDLKNQLDFILNAKKIINASN